MDLNLFAIVLFFAFIRIIWTFFSLNFLCQFADLSDKSNGFLCFIHRCVCVVQLIALFLYLINFEMVFENNNNILSSSQFLYLAYHRIRWRERFFTLLSQWYESNSRLWQIFIDNDDKHCAMLAKLWAFRN